MPVMTRLQRRTLRLQRFVTAKQARLAARLARVDYRVSNESGALKVPSKVRTWHLNNRLNGHAPPPGQAWDRAGPAYVVEALSLVGIPKPITNHRWRRMVADQRAGRPIE